MESTTIVTYPALLRQLAELKVEKEAHEEHIKNTFLDVVSSINIGSLFNIATQQDRPMELAKTGVTMVVNLITDLLLGKHRSFKGYLSAIMVEKFTSVVIDHNLLSIISGVKSLFKKKNQSNEE